ncbi:MAG: diacylglycerol kinase [Oceanospirillaceae bacterium]|uniref:diheme cytochrome c n=1 Tax=unclassified Thalassolituus TaxID=2624967 RepID=UPI000C58B9B4|nr:MULTISPECIES: diheme cytochrome c [unclassified Thalassolituus]MAS24497.1 diacylglycerol kinase [Oceanospirillaceae bacterium]MAX98596.1 diacylglycerol kinase [Oceanospirillaceae bacterium]MBL34357.1 diacylglycerol kinase [Oceanospirillaceae bacterium]MBS51820.1 diacylglycerol kinase [Oceanospirillaceae bacterium]|tara:strand:+ start:372 stop:1037 length:666 start_codon:yes stop_codon:yes gene_type:complete
MSEQTPATSEQTPATAEQTPAAAGQRSKVINVLRYGAGSLLLGGALVLGLYGVGGGIHTSLADSDHKDDDHSYRQYEDYRNASAAPQNALYAAECSSCHIAYPAKFLPARSWQALMSGLDDHFGEDASLTPAQQSGILNYLTSAAGDDYKFSRRLDDQETPLRITELPYFLRKHDEVPQRMVQDNPQVRSFSQCDSCHRQAAKGRFNEHEVDIPGFGRWDD